MSDRALIPASFFFLVERLDGPRFSYVLWYNGPTEVYDEKFHDAYPLLYGRFVSIYYGISH